MLMLFDIDGTLLDRAAMRYTRRCVRSTASTPRTSVR